LRFRLIPPVSPFVVSRQVPQNPGSTRIHDTRPPSVRIASSTVRFPSGTVT